MSVKISELPILDSLADNDVIAGVDTSANVTSKIEMATLKNYIDTNTQYTAGTNIDITNNVVSAPNVYNKTETDGLIDDLETNINEQLEEKDEQIEELQSEVDSLSTIFNAFPTESGEGESLTLDDTAEVKFKKFDLKGNTSQSGTPTPTSPIPVNVVSGDNEIVVCEKNLLNLGNKNETTHPNGITYKVENNVISLSGTNTSSSAYSLISWTDNATQSYYNNLFQKGRTFTLSANNIARVYFQFNYFKEGSSTQSQLANLGSLDSELTFTIPNDFGKIGTIFIGIYETATTINGDFSFQLEKGSTKTTFEPYQGNTYNIDLPEGMELCSSPDGTYRDYFLHDKTLDKWYLHREIGKVVLNGSENISIYNQNTSRTNFEVRNILSGVESYTDSSSMPNLLSNRFISNTQGATWVVGNMSRRNVEEVNEYLYLTYEPSTTIEAFKTWLGTNNIPVYYVYATPINTEITYQPLIDQLNLLEKAMSKDGQTNISQVSNDKPFILDVTAIKSLQNVLDRIELLES